MRKAGRRGTARHTSIHLSNWGACVRLVFTPDGHPHPRSGRAVRWSTARFEDGISSNPPDHLYGLRQTRDTKNHRRTAHEVYSVWRWRRAEEGCGPCLCLVLACFSWPVPRREATHNLGFRERYLTARAPLRERRCPRRIVHSTPFSVSVRVGEIKPCRSLPHHNLVDTTVALEAGKQRYAVGICGL